TKCGSAVTKVIRGVLERLVIARFRAGAGEAEALSVSFDEAVVVDAFTALCTGEAVAFVAGEFLWRQGDADPFLGEEVGIGHFAVGEHLLPVFVVDIGVQGAGQLLRRFAGGDADGAAARNVDEGGGHLAPVAEFKRALAQAAAGDDADGVGGAAVDFDEGDEAFAIAAPRLLDVQAPAAEEGHAHAENLAGAEVAVRGFGQGEEVFEGFHERDSYPRCYARPWDGVLQDSATGTGSARLYERNGQPLRHCQ